jgi:predicted NUDIX family NTP pyrophosphohydrolase
MGNWSIPKGELEEQENALDAAKREFLEETGIAVNGEFIELTPIQQKSGKRVYAWGLAGNLDPSSVVSNTFEMEWPPRSGKKQSFPEIDKAAWFSMADASQKINPSQLPLLQELAAILAANIKG